MKKNETVQPDRLLLRVPEAAKMLGISVSMLYEMIREGKVGTVTVGSRGVRILHADVKKWTEGNVRYRSADQAA